MHRTGIRRAAGCADVGELPAPGTGAGARPIRTVKGRVAGLGGAWLGVVACAGAAALLAPPVVHGQAQPADPPQAAGGFAAPSLATWHVRDGIYMLVGAGGNVTVQVGEDGVLVVDTQFAEGGQRLLAAIRELADGPIRYVVNTHAHRDHVGGNEVIAPAGSTIAGGNVSGAISDADVGAAVIAHENVLRAISAADPEIPFAAWPTDTFIGGEKDLYFNGEPVLIMHQPAAHTDGDSIVFFRRTDVISTGDVYSTTLYPVILPGDGGSIDGVIAALNRIIQLTVPEEKQEGGTLVIPGHGRLSDEADVVEYRDMVTIIRDRIASMVDAGMSLEQVKAARPTRDYDGRYGADSGFWTTEQFVEAAYANLARAAAE
jgi:cyclase